MRCRDGKLRDDTGWEDDEAEVGRREDWAPSLTRLLERNGGEEWKLLLNGLSRSHSTCQENQRSGT